MPSLAGVPVAAAEFVLEAAAGASTSGSARDIAAIVLWFDTDFSARFCKDTPVVLSTAPTAPVTHWVQTVLPLPAAVPLAAAGSAGEGGAAARIVGRLSMARSHSKHRQLDISVEYCGQGAAGEPVTGQQVAVFSLDVIGD
jgi:protein arginine N-methyltransferase 3